MAAGPPLVPLHEVSIPLRALQDWRER